jgi:tungstate transport system substrate-binding protein
MPERRTLIALAIVFSLAQLSSASAQQNFITVASTTSTEDSGLFGFILPRFKQKTGIDVRVVALGTGQALDVGRRGDADVVFVHAKAEEEKFVAEGFGVKRNPVMYNDFIIVGPKSDPAGIRDSRQAAFGLRAIRDKRAPFISRGDNSGTHIAEINLWNSIGIDIKKEAGPWYRSVGQGMGAVLNIAAESEAYTMSDRGTWISFKNKRDLVIAIEGDKLLFNQYGVILVNPARHPQVKKELGQQFIDWLISDEGQETIARYKIDGEQVFWPQRE